MTVASTQLQIFGIKNCDTVKKATKWLTNAEVVYNFHDFKTNGLSETLLQQFVALSSWDVLINKRSTTFRQLPDEVKANIAEHDVAFTAVLAQPTLLKRPLALINNQLHVGFKDTTYQEIFS